MKRSAFLLIIACVLCVFITASSGTADEYQERIKPLLSTYCFECHADGAKEGNVAFDGYASDTELLNDRRFWWNALKNVRADIMPPHPSERPNADEKKLLLDWIKTSRLGIDPAQSDPGRVTLRRLNRVEYRNTIRDLMGIDYDTQVEFPPDDTGHGFDTVGDVLSVSPLLLEKYLQAAEQIVTQAVPTVSRVMPRKTFGGSEFRAEEGRRDGGQLSFYDATVVKKKLVVEAPADYQIALDYQVSGGFDFDPGRCRLVFRIDGFVKVNEELPWHENKSFNRVIPVTLNAGEHVLEWEVQPLVAVEERKNGVSLRLRTVRLEGPLDRGSWTVPEAYAKFFPRPEPPTTSAERLTYAREILKSFATRAFRRPVDDAYLDRLCGLAERVYSGSEQSFEDGIVRAMIAVLASPRFVFRVEGAEPNAADRFPMVDEYALASRLSYFFWATMPDDELMHLAAKHELRANLDQQVRRLMNDRRADAMIGNFVGQWLQTRDVETVSIDPLSAVGAREEYDQLRDNFIRRRGNRSAEGTPGASEEEIATARQRFTELREIRDSLDARLRKAMRRETEMLFETIVREDRSVLDLIDASYTFLNEPLAKHYKIPELQIADVQGDDMRRVELPAGSARGGVLTQASFLMVTSNPTRTSPVKRGLFILDNILGTPAPPAPGAVPELEEAKKALTDRKPTLREMLEIHRQEPLCNSCHQRFDPLGLALENFNALGMWRDEEAGRPIEVAGSLITGESFADIRELKQILKGSRRQDFYRCLASKLMVYALGRGLEDYDEQTLDRIVGDLDAADGRFSALLSGIVQSAPFQRTRLAENRNGDNWTCSPE